MRLVIVESPFAGRGDTPEARAIDAARNLRYLRACLRDSLLRGESPYASHGLYTQDGVLDDSKPGERALGIEAGFAWRRKADATVFYTDLGLSGGMSTGTLDALGMAVERPDHVVVHRRLGGVWAAACPRCGADRGDHCKLTLAEARAAGVTEPNGAHGVMHGERK